MDRPGSAAGLSEIGAGYVPKVGADGFAVDYEGLAALGQQLAELRGELENGEDAIGPLLGTGSDDQLRGKLSEFAENWSEKRYSVTRQLERWRAWPRRPPMRIATSTRPMPRLLQCGEEDDRREPLMGWSLVGHPAHPVADDSCSSCGRARSRSGASGS